MLRNVVVSGGRDGNGIVEWGDVSLMPARGKLDFVLTSSL